MSDHQNVTTTMDIAVVLDCSLSISFYFAQIRRTILSILRKALLCDESDIRIALSEFQSHSNDWVARAKSFTSSVDTFEEWINAVQTKGENFHNCKAIADALNVCLKLDWRPNNNSSRYHEKLVILITDGPPCNFFNDQCPRNYNDLWEVSNEFERQDITLVVIGIEPSIVECDDFYCALAQNTGGEYLPLINASRILSFVIPQAITGELTLSQLFRHIDTNDIEFNSLYHYSHVEKRARYMIEYCRTMTDIRNRLYSYRLQPAESAMDVIIRGDIYSEPYTPPLNWSDFGRSYRHENLFTPTPIIDDEGYRTPLPTTASVGSSSICFPDRSFTAIDVEWSSECDDSSV